MGITGVATVLAVIAFLIWWYRQGKQNAALDFYKDETAKTGDILNEAKRIDDETHAQMAEYCGDDGSDPRDFWMSDRSD